MAKRAEASGKADIDFSAMPMSGKDDPQARIVVATARAANTDERRLGFGAAFSIQVFLLSGSLFTQIKDQGRAVRMDHSSLPSRLSETRLPPLSGIQAVAMVAEVGSLTAAADRLGLTHGAVSRRVASVEQWLGLPIFERHGRGMILNADGQRFLSRIEAAFEILEDANDIWKSSGHRRLVRLSATPSTARYMILPHLAELENNTVPGTTLRIEVDAEYRTLDLEKGEADITVRYGLGRWPGASARKLHSESLVPVASSVIAANLSETATPDGILAYPLIYDSDLTGWKAWFRKANMGVFRPRRTDRRFEDYDLVLKAAQVGLGIALARLPFAQARIDSLGLVPLSPLRAESPLALYTLTKQHEHRETVLALERKLHVLFGDDHSF